MLIAFKYLQYTETQKLESINGIYNKWQVEQWSNFIIDSSSATKPNNFPIYPHVEESTVGTRYFFHYSLSMVR